MGSPTIDRRRPAAAAARVPRERARTPSIRLQSISDTDGGPATATAAAAAAAMHRPPRMGTTTDAVSAAPARCRLCSILRRSPFLSVSARVCVCVSIYLCMCPCRSVTNQTEAQRVVSTALTRSLARVVSRQNKYILRFAEFVFSLRASRSICLSLQVTQNLQKFGRVNCLPAREGCTQIRRLCSI